MRPEGLSAPQFECVTEHGNQPQQTYSLKKATRHYTDELKKLFDRGIPEKGEQSAAGASADHNETIPYCSEIFRSGQIPQAFWNNISTRLGHPIDLKKSAAFFAQWSQTSVAEKYDPQNDLEGVFLAAMVEIENDPTLKGGASQEGNGRHFARLTWAAYHKKSVQDALRTDPLLLQKLLRQIERWAAGQKCTKLVVDLSAKSLFIGHIPPNRGYKISQHVVGENGDLSIRFNAALPPAYVGDSENWNDLSEWYTRLTFFSRMPPLEIKESIDVPEGDSFQCRDYLLPANNIIEDSILKQKQTDIDVRVLSAESDFDPDQHCEKVFLNNRGGRLNLCLLNTTVPLTKEKIENFAYVADRTNIRDSLKDVFIYYNRQVRNSKLRDVWKKRYNLHYCDVNDRKAVIVEIDRESYVDLVKRLIDKKDPIKQSLIYFNHISTEKLNANTPVYFYVWDAETGEAQVDSQKLNGVIAAKGLLMEPPVRMTQQQAIENWRQLGPHTIWPKFDRENRPFTRDYFEDEFVALKINNLEVYYPLNIDSRAKEFMAAPFDRKRSDFYEEFYGVSHLKLAEILFEQELNLDQVLQYLPTWEVANTFVSTIEHRRQIDKAFNSATEGKRKLFLSSDYARHAGTQTGVRGAKADDGEILRNEVRAFVKNPPEICEEHTWDIVLSFHDENEEIAEEFRQSVLRAAQSMGLDEESLKIYKFDSPDAPLSQDNLRSLMMTIWSSRVVVPFLSTTYFDTGRLYIQNLELPLIAEARRNDRIRVHPIWVDDVHPNRLKFPWDDYTLCFNSIDHDVKMKSESFREIQGMPANTAIVKYGGQLRKRFENYASNFLEDEELLRRIEARKNA